METSPLICGANQSTGFYMITASVMKGLICSSIMETLELDQTSIKVGFIKFCQFYYTYENCKYCVHQQRKEQFVRILISLSKFSRRIPKYYFSAEVECTKCQSRTSKDQREEWNYFWLIVERGMGVQIFIKESINE